MGELENDPLHNLQLRLNGPQIFVFVNASFD